MQAHLLTIGDELLIGQTVNTNAAWLGEQLSMMGVDVVSAMIVSDNVSSILDGLQYGFDRADLVITTGGLGPTHDDITVEAVARYFDRPLNINDQLLENLRAYYKDTGREMPDAVRKLARVPDGFEVIGNHHGTAPGLWFESPENKMIAILPGVPSEMKGLFEPCVTEQLEKRDVISSLQHRTLRTTGIVESSLQEKVGDVSSWEEKGVKLAYLPSPMGVRLRLTARHDDPAEVEKRLDVFESYLREKIDKFIYGTGTDLLEERLGEILQERDLTIGVAESCTGGYVLHRLTNISGASNHLLGGVVAYSNKIKVNQLNVSVDALLRDGAVSEVVALQMAQGVRQRLGTDIGISSTGIAGPTGGTADKPVGTIWIGYATEHEDYAVELRFTKDRILNKKLFSSAVLDTARRKLLNIA